MRAPIPQEKILTTVNKITDLAMSFGSKVKTEEELRKEKEELAVFSA